MPLTTGEFSLLKVLAQHPRQPLAREKLMELARGRDHEVFDRAIDVQISRLRKLSSPIRRIPRYIQTVWGFGYVFVPEGTTPKCSARRRQTSGDRCCRARCSGALSCCSSPSSRSPLLTAFMLFSYDRARADRARSSATRRSCS